MERRVTEGRVEEQGNGRMEEWNDGRMEWWKNGRVEEWKDGVVEEPISLNPIFQHSSIPLFQSKLRGLFMKMKFLVVYFFIGMMILCGNVLAEERPFHIGPGDVLEISVWKDESLSRQVVVPPDRMISFPLIGDINVSNQTVGALRETIRKRLADYVPDATVTVMLTQINSLKGYVIGKVNRPGQFSIDLNTNVMQILSMAGGLNPYASSKNIIILRQEGDTLQKIPFNYNEVEKGENLEQNIILKRGDVVVVP
jgi:polysaccharide export outer membrane protein